MNRIMLKSYLIGRSLSEEQAVEAFRYAKKKARFIRIKWNRIGFMDGGMESVPDGQFVQGGFLDKSVLSGKDVLWRI